MVNHRIISWTGTDRLCQRSLAHPTSITTNLDTYTQSDIHACTNIHISCRNTRDKVLTYTLKIKASSTSLHLVPPSDVSCVMIMVSSTHKYKTEARNLKKQVHKVTNCRLIKKFRRTEMITVKGPTFFSFHISSGRMRRE